ncbi:hypothetical protein AgCh_015950 [Apium graveolens]
MNVTFDESKLPEKYKDLVDQENVEQDDIEKEKTDCCNIFSEKKIKRLHAVKMVNRKLTQSATKSTGANVMPKPNQNYMPYGMLISSFFALCNINMPEAFSNLADSQITNEHIRPQVPLIHCEPQKATPAVIPQFIREEDVFLFKFEFVKIMFHELKLELKRVKEENNEIKEKVGELESLTASCKHRIAYLEHLAASTLGTPYINDHDIVTSFQVPMHDNIAMIHELEEVNVGARGQLIDNLPDLVHIYDANGNVIG